MAEPEYTDLAACIEALRAAGFYVERSQMAAVAERQEVIDALNRMRRIDAEKIVNLRQERQQAFVDLAQAKAALDQAESRIEQLKADIASLEERLRAGGPGEVEQLRAEMRQRRADYKSAIDQAEEIIHALVDERVQARREFNLLARVFVRKSERQKERDDPNGAGPEDELTELERRVVGVLTTKSQYDWEIAQQSKLQPGLVRRTLAGAALCGAATKTWEGMWVLPGPEAYATTRRYPCAE